MESIFIIIERKISRKPINSQPSSRPRKSITELSWHILQMLIYHKDKKKRERLQEPSRYTGSLLHLFYFIIIFKITLPDPNGENVSVVQSCLTLCDPRDRSPPGSPVHAMLQARMLEWVAIPFSRWRK